MSIRINLLAEAQAIEDLRRRDPVKRLILGGIVLVGLILAWSSSLMVKTIIVKGDVQRFESNLNARTNEYHQILDNQRKLEEDKQRLQALHELATNRFLIGNVLDALQKSTVDNVQLQRIKLDQSYTSSDDAKTKDAKTKDAKAGTATERILLTLNARDNSPNPGDGISKYQDALSSLPYFRDALGKTGGFRLTSLGSPQTDPNGKSFVLFTVETHFPDRIR